MDSLTFTINLKDLNDPEHPEEALNDIKLIIKLLQNANPNYYLIGNLLDEQLNKQLAHPQVDPRTPVEKMQEKFCDFFDAANLGFTAWDMNERHGDDPVPGYFDAWDEFLKSIGGAPMVVTYTGAKLRRKFSEAGQDYSWIDKCVDYYEANWEAE